MNDNSQNNPPGQGMAIPCGGSGAELPVNGHYTFKNSLEGVILGCAIGDSLGLPAERLSSYRIKKNGWNSWRQRFIFGKGMISDDTEHTLFVAQAILAHPNDVDGFQKCLASKLRWWLFSLPAGTGMATARAIIKLWLGVLPNKSAVFSAGNGPAMRSAIIGAMFADDPDKIYSYVKASTLITHSDPKALTGALAVAHLASILAKGEPLDNNQVLSRMRALNFMEEDWNLILEKMDLSLKSKLSVQDFCRALNLEHGVSGYTYHTVPVVIYSILFNDADFEKSLTDVMNCGGDVDTTGAISGAILGAKTANTKVPVEWLDNIIEWPRSVTLMRRVAAELNKLKSGHAAKPVTYFVPFILLRNLFFLIIVLSHGLLRLLPSFLIKRLIK